jgi:hypothetical protein
VGTQQGILRSAQTEHERKQYNKSEITTFKIMIQCLSNPRNPVRQILEENYVVSNDKSRGGFSASPKRPSVALVSGLNTTLIQTAKTTLIR